MKDTIYFKITKAFSPNYLEVVDDSDKHIGHASAKEGGESHFTIIIDCQILHSMPKVKAHRAIYDLLTEEFSKTLHALSIKIIKKETL
jgi:BolA protein